MCYGGSAVPEFDTSLAACFVTGMPRASPIVVPWAWTARRLSDPGQRHVWDPTDVWCGTKEGTSWAVVQLRRNAGVPACLASFFQGLPRTSHGFRMFCRLCEGDSLLAHLRLPVLLPVVARCSPYGFPTDLLGSHCVLLHRNWVNLDKIPAYPHAWHVAP